MAMDLVSKSCAPCRGGVTPMSAEVAERDYLKYLPGWTLIDGGTKIERRFVFPDFKSAMKFANQVGDLAELEGHHPDLAVGWGYCNVVSYTHKIEGLHENDFILASKINRL